VTSTFQLALDTTAPQITWGAVDGANITETLTVEYVLDEPAVLSAQLELADGRLIDMAVAPTLLSVLVPGDAPEGWGTVHATLRDAVHNTATADLPVYISGVLGPPPPVPVTPPTAPPQGVARHPVRKDFGESRARVPDDIITRRGEGPKMTDELSALDLL
jgi:hypothetical protein